MVSEIGSSNEFEQMLTANGMRRSKSSAPHGFKWASGRTETAWQARDIGIVVTAEFKPRLHCQKAVEKVWLSFRKLKRIAGFNRPTVLLQSLKAFVWPQLEYCV